MIRLAFLVLCFLSLGAVPAAATDFMLSFDDGPVPGATEAILDQLATLQGEDGRPVRAAFFLVGDAPRDFWTRREYYAPYELWTGKGSVAEYPELLWRIVAAGHVVGNHSVHHGWFRWPWLSGGAGMEEEIAGWKRIAGPLLPPGAPRLFRPPYLMDTPAVREAAVRAGYRVVLGEVSGDGSPLATPYAIVEGVSALLKKWAEPRPALLIFHEIRPSTRAHLADMVRELEKRGFRLVHFDADRLEHSVGEQRPALQAAVQPAGE